MSAKELFIKLPHIVFDSPEFASLSPIDVCVLLLLIRKYNGRNNGAIALGLQEVVIKCRCSKSTAGRSLHRLQQAGFITLCRKGHAVGELGRPNVASRWQLNFVAANPKPARPREFADNNSGNRWYPNGTNGCPTRVPNGRGL